MDIKRIAAVITMLFFVPAAAVEAHFTDTGAGARGCGMANAFTGIADDVSAVYYNPAGLARIGKKEIAIDYSRLYAGLSDNSGLGNGFMGYVHPLGFTGTAGIAWKNFALSEYYSEDVFMLAFGKSFSNFPLLGFVNAGVTLKQMTKGYSPTQYTQNAVNIYTGAQLDDTDPVFGGGYSKTAIGLDFGMLYEADYSHSIAFTVKNINQPDMGLSAEDRVTASIGAGYAYRSGEMSVSCDMLSGEGDTITTIGAERWFSYGTYAVRGGLGLGSSEYGNLSLGGTYRYSELFQLDYCFVLPLRGISGTMGSHRVSLTLRFGGDIRDEYDIMMELQDTRKGIKRAQRLYNDAMRQTDDALDILRRNEGATYRMEESQKDLEKRLKKLEKNRW